MGFEGYCCEIIFVGVWDGIPAKAIKNTTYNFIAKAVIKELTI